MSIRFNWQIKDAFLESVKADAAKRNPQPEDPRSFLQKIKDDVARGKFNPAKILGITPANLQGEPKKPRTPRKSSRKFPVGYKQSRRVRPDFKQ